MGFYKTENCFFTNSKVVSCDELDSKVLDGYYYRVRHNGQTREVRLIWDYDWTNDEWLKNNGEQFFQLLDESENWNFFDHGKDIVEIKRKYDELKQAGYPD